MMITVVEYARRIGKRPNYIRDRCTAGKFKTAARINGVWMVDENEPYPQDARYRNGNYVGWRNKYGRKK